MGEGLKDVFFNKLTEDSSSVFGDDSDNSMHSSQEDLTDDASSSSLQNSASNASHGPLYGLSSLMAELPIKRGLSGFFDGKSQSFASLSDAKHMEDLAKTQTPFNGRMKSSKSYAGGLDGTTRTCYAPGVYIKAIAKKTSSRSSCASLMSRRSSSSNILYRSKPPSLPVLNKNLRVMRNFRVDN